MSPSKENQQNLQLRLFMFLLKTKSSQRRVFNLIRGFLVGLGFLANLIIVPTFVLLFALIQFLLPFKWWRQFFNAIAVCIHRNWYSINGVLLRMGLFPGKWEVVGHGELNRKSWYLIICNHQSSVDIFLLGAVFIYKIPLLKFFMKKQLLWTLPFASWVCYVSGSPFLNRYSKSEIKKNPQLKLKDAEATKKACEVFRNDPTTVINFVEGTRCTPEKQKRSHSPFRHLLKPRAGGISTVMSGMSDYLTGIINVTIKYEGATPTLWNCICGNVDRIKIHYEVLPITPDMVGDYYEDKFFRIQFQHWLNHIWEQKDRVLDRI